MSGGGTKQDLWLKRAARAGWVVGVLVWLGAVAVGQDGYARTE